jgi:hypothetical protein
VDYPELNLLVGQGLAVLLGLNLGLLFLINRIELPAFLKIGLGILVAGLALNARLVVVLYRNLVPAATAIPVLNPISLTHNPLLLC